MATIETHGEKLRHFRRARGFTQLELALVAGVSERTVRSAERGRPIRRELVDYLAQALGVGISELVREPVAVAGLVRWKHRAAVLMETLLNAHMEEDPGAYIEMLHPDYWIDVRCEPGLSASPHGHLLNKMYGTFLGTSGCLRLFDVSIELSSELGERKASFHAPAGYDNLLVLRGTEQHVDANGEKWAGWWVHEYVYHNDRILRCNETIGRLPLNRTTSDIT